ncbi:nucleotidyltransferase domain-containing protein [Nonomuraea sp. NPDC050556]|uniref:nucleotidyltransferase domain-containing protein n=1 Tax=Nonomuraea sp. NPDC050556 TaxID=3364369 RepID=UPI0037B9A9FE
MEKQLIEVPGVVAVALGGSRARGTHRPDSDVDLGIYYRGTLDTDALRELAGDGVEVTEPGGWGPWVNGGAWLTVDGTRVDWIFRDLDRVERVWADCQEGRYEVAVQAGHPLGFYSHAYAGEVAFCKILEDPSGELTALREETRAYPPALGEALVRGLWEADFCLRIAAKGDDPAYRAGCLFKAVGVMCHALHGRDGAWLINEKGMVASAGRLPSAPDGFAVRAQALFSGTASLEDAADLLEDCR